MPPPTPTEPVPEPTVPDPVDHRSATASSIREIDPVENSPHPAFAPPPSMVEEVTMSNITSTLDRFAANMSQLVTTQMSQIEARMRADFSSVTDRIDREFARKEDVVSQEEFAELKHQVDELLNAQRGYTARSTISGYGRDVGNNRAIGSTSARSRPAPSAFDELGPEEYGLVELVPAEGRFARLLSYRRYRLNNTDAEESDAVMHGMKYWRRNIKPTMECHPFSGENPVSILVARM